MPPEKSARRLGRGLDALFNAPIEQATTSSRGSSEYLIRKDRSQIYSSNSREALPLFNRAVEIDPNFAEAYVWLA